MMTDPTRGTIPSPRRLRTDAASPRPVPPGLDGEGEDDPAALRRAELAAEARRWSRGHLRAEDVARRSARGPLEARGDAPEDLTARVERRALRMRLRFHRAIERLVVAGGFEEARSILHERQGRLAGLRGEDSPQRHKAERD